MTVKGRFTAGGAETILGACLGGAGICRLASFTVAPHLRTGELEELLIDFKVPDPVPLAAVYPSNKHVLPKLRMFIDHLVGAFQPNPPWEHGGDRQTSQGSNVAANSCLGHVSLSATVNAAPTQV